MIIFFLELLTFFPVLKQEFFIHNHTGAVCQQEEVECDLDPQEVSRQQQISNHYRAWTVEGGAYCRGVYIKCQGFWVSCSLL